MYITSEEEPKRVGFQSGFLGGQSVLPAAVLIGAEWMGLQVSTPTSTRAVPLSCILCSRNLPRSVKMMGPVPKLGDPRT